MNKFFKSAVALGAVACLSVSFAGCEAFTKMKEKAAEAVATTLCSTPDDENAFAELNSYIDAAYSKADKISENVSYGVGKVTVTNSDGEGAGLLGSSANTLKNMIMENNPGSSSRDIMDKGNNEPGVTDTGLLGVIDASSALDYEVFRNRESENVTDEKGEEVTVISTDTDGNPFYETVTVVNDADNMLNFTLRYYSTEKSTASDGSEEVSFTPADDATIESVFGTAADKQTVLAAFDCIKDYIVANSYDIAYGNCEITASIDLETGEVGYVKFVQKMNVTASATGAGVLAEYGDMTVEFEVTKTTEYSFTYPLIEE